MTATQIFSASSGAAAGQPGWSPSALARHLAAGLDRRRRRRAQRREIARLTPQLRVDIGLDPPPHERPIPALRRGRP